VLNQKQALKCSVLQGMPLDENSDNYSSNKGGKTPLLLSHSTGKARVQLSCRSGQLLKNFVFASSLMPLFV